MFHRSLLVLVALTSCSASKDPRLIATFDPPAVAAGYTRYIPAAYDVKPGEDVMLCQWVAAPSDTVLDVVDVNGAQTEGGHHIVLYSTKDPEPVGTSRPCTNADMLSVDYLGGAGGEGGVGNGTKLPANTVFRLEKGRALMANTHYLNTSSRMMKAQSVIDIKFTPPAPEHRTAGLAGVNVGLISVPPRGKSVIDAYCTWDTDSNFIMFSNHMHEHGTNAFTEVKRAAGGTTTMVSKDDVWTPERTFNPRWDRFDEKSPLTIKAGDELHIHCEWNNATDRELTFPDEMCVGIGVYLGSSEQRFCNGVKK